MVLNIIKTQLPGVIQIEPACFKDNRGFFLETYHQAKYKGAGIEKAFVQDNHSHSSKHILRGLHFQLNHPQDKLIYPVTGEIFDVAVDIRRGSPTFCQWAGAYLSAQNKRQMYVPGGFAHGFIVLSEAADVIYKCTDVYSPGDEYGIYWNDPEIGIKWPADTPVLSEKDRQNPALKDIPEKHLPVYK
jgi:dTDP-4-dehydrorhamnose 3,5-epimerase